MIMNFSNLLLITGATPKRQPPDLVPPVCYNLPCLTKTIHTKIYVDDALWKKMQFLWDNAQRNDKAFPESGFWSKKREKWGSNPTGLIIS